MNKIRLNENFELLDSNGNFMELACFRLEENIDIFTGRVKDYKLKIKLLGHDNNFTEGELKEYSSNTGLKLQGDKNE